ncbi:unnamed protein product [Mytilus coruscus]|uniref:Uncharacterized protein n=1 Tax=Mytilus coruscus TaxID=42192 RepID=A0A6J8EBC0_MYTCO|nr:unnamed protein product [Mytilus coruscus]
MEKNYDQGQGADTDTDEFYVNHTFLKRSVQMKSMFVQNEHVTKTYTDILLGMQFNEADNTPDQAPDDNIVSIPYSSVLETNVYDLDVGIMRSLISQSAVPLTSPYLYINGTEEECVETVNHDPIEPQETGEGDKVVQETDEEQVAVIIQETGQEKGQEPEGETHVRYEDTLKCSQL